MGQTSESLVDNNGPYLSDAVLAAERFYEEELQQDRQWMEANKGKYVAITGQDVVDSNHDLASLHRRVSSRFGSGMTFLVKVFEGDTGVAYLTPRLPYLTGRTGRPVYDALADRRWPQYRTVAGITKSTGLNGDKVKQVLEAYPEVVSKLLIPDLQGRTLYTLRAIHSVLITIGEVLGSGGLFFLGNPKGDKGQG